jgi:hypothetical protein
MATWNNNDREESKPTWLNKIQRRLCTRTVRGWEIPLSGACFGYGATGFVASNGSNTQGAVYSELIVTLPNDPSTAGVSPAAYTPRSGNTGSSFGGWGQGVTTASDLPNYAPYFSCPFSGDSATAGGPASVGVTHSSITYNSTSSIQYGVSKLGVSSLGGLTGVTAYIKVVVNDANMTNSLTIGLSGTYNGFNLYTGQVDLNDGIKVPSAVFNAFFGATSTDDKQSAYRYDNIAVLVVGGQTASGTLPVSLKVQDYLTGTVGLTASTTFNLLFDRNRTNTTWASTTTR